MDQTEFRCETCWSSHVSIPDNLRPGSKVLCGSCGSVVATWAEYCGAISLALVNRDRTRAAGPDRPTWQVERR